MTRTPGSLETIQTALSKLQDGYQRGDGDLIAEASRALEEAGQAQLAIVGLDPRTRNAIERLGGHWEYEGWCGLEVWCSSGWTTPEIARVLHLPELVVATVVDECRAESERRKAEARAREDAAEQAARERRREETDRQLATPCEACGALPGQPCRTASGKKAQPFHSARGRA